MDLSNNRFLLVRCSTHQVRLHFHTRAITLSCSPSFDLHRTHRLQLTHTHTLTCCSSHVHQAHHAHPDPHHPLSNRQTFTCVFFWFVRVAHSFDTANDLQHRLSANPCQSPSFRRSLLSKQFGTAKTKKLSQTTLFHF
jgi:hypothetical protein